jgi:glycosyltransferase involved in cell wall biosynthesis
MKEAFHPRHLNEIDVRFKDAKIPLTRHMVATWDRFGLRGSFHLNSDANRFEFILWYVWEHLPGRIFQLPPLPADITSTLVFGDNIRCYENLPQFWYGIWNRYFRQQEEFNIFVEDGYYYFLYHICHEAVKRGLDPQLITSDMKARINSPQPGIGGGDFHLTRGLYQVWRTSKVYREKYRDIHTLFIAQSFIFDRILHSYIVDGMTDYFPMESLAWWRREMHPRFPRLSRFIFELSRFSKKFRGAIERDYLTEALYSEIVRWFDQCILAVTPALVKLAPGVSSTETRPGAATTTKAAAGSRRRLADVIGSCLPTRDETVDLLVIGDYSAASGLGSAMRRSVSALEKCGCNYRVLDLNYDSPSAPIEESIPRRYNGEKARFNLWHFNAESVFDVISTYYPLTANRRNIGYFFWETEALPICHELGQDAVDEIWAPSEFVRQIYAKASGPVVNVGTSVELPVSKDHFDRPYFGLADDEVVFMFSFDSHSVIHRKNPAAALRAFIKAFGKTDHRVRFILKTQHLLIAHWEGGSGRGEELLELCQYDRRITLLNKTLTLRELYSLKNCCDCYVSLHRSEGFGYGPAEAMALGKPVIMSDYSANKEFGNRDNALMVPGKMIPVAQNEYLCWNPTMQWFDPDVDVAADYMTQVYKDPQLREALGRAAKSSINRDFGVDSMAAKYRRRLTELGVACR